MQTDLFQHYFCFWTGEGAEKWKQGETEGRTGNLRGRWCCGVLDQQALKASRQARKVPAFGGRDAEGEMSSLHVLKRGRLARGRLLEWQRAHSSCVPWLVSSPGHFDVPCRARLSVIPSAALCNTLLRSLTGHPPSSKMLLLVTPWIKEARRDLQMLPSSRFRFRAFKNKVERKWRAWVFCSHTGLFLSVDACLKQGLPQG